MFAEMNELDMIEIEDTDPDSIEQVGQLRGFKQETRDWHPLTHF